MLRPATPYLAEFTRDAPRHKILTARAIMAPVNGSAEFAGEIPAAMKVIELAPMVVDSDKPFLVVDDGQPVGMVDRAAVIAVLVGRR